ncbi:MAG: PQQ-binding-like beta-propeller repeat protein [Planctomycetota bacterium]
MFTVSRTSAMRMFLCLVAACLTGANALGQSAAPQPENSQSASPEPDPSLGPKELWQAASSGDMAGVQACLDAGVDVDAANPYGVTALLLAADHSHTDVAKRLLAAGADPGTRDRFYSFTPLAWSLNRQQYDLSTALVEAGAPDTSQALTRSVYRDNEKAISAILSAKSLPTETIRWAAIRAQLLEKPERLEQLIEALPEDERELPEEDPDPVPPYAGIFKGDAEFLQLIAKEGSLYLKPKPASKPIRLTHLASGEFELGLGKLRFERDDDGMVSSFARTVRRKTVTFNRMPELESLPESTDVDTEDSWTPSDTPDDFVFDDMPWSGFRGHLSRGISNTAVPTSWDIETGENVAWKVPVKGLANSCPIVWDGRVYLTTAVSENEEADGFQTGLSGSVDSIEEDDPWSFRVLCLDLETGEVIWNEEATRAVPAVKRHAKSSHANPTPVTDGNSIIASFGSEGVYCFDLKGRLQWKRDLGLMDSGWFYDRSYQWGYASSPCLIDDRVILQCDIQDQSFLIALDLKTGETLWRTDRDEIPTWGTPVAYNTPDGKSVVVVSGTKANAAYDLETGKLIWELGGFSEIVAPTPQVLPWGVLLSAGYPPVKPLTVVRHEARGKLELPDPSQGDLAGSDDAFVWSRRSGGPYMSTPVVHQGLAYVIDTGGILTCYDATNGERVYKKRLRGGGASSFTGSPVVAGEYVYFPSEQGVIQIVRCGSTFEKQDPSEIGEATLATPAIADGYLLIRGESHLFALKYDDAAEKP